MPWNAFGARILHFTSKRIYFLMFYNFCLCFSLCEVFFLLISDSIQFFLISQNIIQMGMLLVHSFFYACFKLYFCALTMKWSIEHWTINLMETMCCRKEKKWKANCELNIKTRHYPNGFHMLSFKFAFYSGQRLNKNKSVNKREDRNTNEKERDRQQFE